MSGEENPVGDHYAIYLESYRIVYSLEQQPLKDGSGYQWCCHLSVSISNKNKYPHPESCNLILEQFGMPKVEKCVIWLENENDDELPSAVNFVSEYNGKM